MSEAAFTIRHFETGDEADFARLNLEWIEANFGIEDEDRKQLEQSKRMILERGGYIAIAEMDGDVVGTGALIPAVQPPETFEKWGQIVKMATTSRAQGHGIGAAILERLITTARELGMPGLWLETNSKLAAASRLYIRTGFIELEPHELWETPYERCNLQMILKL